MSVPETPQSKLPPQDSLDTPVSALRNRLVNATFDNYNEDEDPTFVAEDETEVSSDSDDSVSVISDEISLSDDTMDSESLNGNEIETKGASSVLESKPPKESWKNWLIRHEVPRKALHSSMAFITLWLYTLGFTLESSVLPIGAITVLLFINDFIRLHNPKVNKLVMSYVGFASRPSEVNGYNGTLFYAAGVFLVVSMAPKDIAVMSVLLLSWADTAASTVGRRWGKYTPKVMPGKSLAGCLASFLTGVVSCYLFYGYFCTKYAYVNRPGDIYWTEATSKLNLHTYALASGLTASLSEAADIGGIDDNFIIPVASAVLLYGLVSATHL